MDEFAQVTIYTDGACIGNPGPGGYAAVLLCQGRRREIQGGFRRTTSNRMELMAAIAALEALKTVCRITLVSDSRYLVDGISQGWAERWRRNGWRRGEGVAENADLWSRLLALCDGHAVQCQWVRGHSGDPENERCDELAEMAAGLQDMPADEAFEQQKTVLARTLFDEIPV